MTPANDWLTPGEVALECRIGTPVVLAAIKSGELRAVRFNRRVFRVHVSDLHQWIRFLTVSHTRNSANSGQLPAGKG